MCAVQPQISRLGSQGNQHFTACKNQGNATMAMTWCLGDKKTHSVKEQKFEAQPLRPVFLAFAAIRVNFVNSFSNMLPFTCLLVMTPDSLI